MRFANIAALLKGASPDVVEMNFGENPKQAREPREPKPVLTPEQSNLKVLEDKFFGNWIALGGPDLAREYRFDYERRWRFDFALPEIKVAIEVQGGLYTSKSGHRSQEGVERDYEKLNAAQRLGWKVFQLSSKSVQDSRVIQELVDYVKLLL